ncbi:LysR family transcriptional regulator [Bordetella genomosp. 10]|uniref:LysR family transcriptional regulator n=1 Tax=Bordetella genomosp. 10 TaxID=1416804 RepID=A0A261SJ51_9BORD|nr:LysR substrate-binding domain-containing protein [Bordetella genomosp. 10]OZI37469.1 LysR family transcriptional regulator [Bordetella genomosp. 10]
MIDKLDGVTTFVQVVEAGGFAAAAERLDLTRSAVGKAIARLEARLGVRLIQRNTRNQALTAEGLAYYERCVRALAELDAGEADLDSGRMAPSGRLRVSVPEAFGQLCVAPVLLDLTRQHPALHVDLSFTDRYVDLIEEGFDLAVRIGALEDSSTLAARRLGTQHTGIGASPAYLARHGTPRDVDDLEGHVRIAYSHGGATAAWTLRDAAGRTRRVDVPTQISMDDIQAIANAAAEGLGLAWLPSWLMAHYVRRGALVQVLENTAIPPQEIYAVWPRVRHLRCKTRAAIDALVARIPALMGAETASRHGRPGALIP